MGNGNNQTKIDESRDEVVPFFKTDRSQIIFEFLYLVFTFWAAIIVVLLVHFNIGVFSIDHHSKVLLFSALGGTLGGWTFDAKWFYRVTAKGKNNQYNFTWESHKFYWRLFIPFLSGIVAFSVYALASANILPVTVGDVESSRVSFGLCFILGYFSDLVMTKLAKWVESTLPEKKAHE
jgi:hypothetical protein